MSTETKPDVPHRRARATLALLALLALAQLGMKGEPFRFTRGVDAQPGFNLLELPDDVLAAARPGLADLRLHGPDGELGYVFEGALALVAPRLPFRNVESQPNVATSALLDRGDTRALCSELTLAVAGTEPFLKPLVLEASADGQTFARLAQGSIFRLSSGEGSFTLRFPLTERRFLRLRLDDSQGAPILPLSGTCRETSAPPTKARELPLAVERKVPGDGDVDAFVVRLPTPNLPVVELLVATPDLAFSREARVYEAVIFRGELSRRLVGVSQLRRFATGEVSLGIVLGQLSSSQLELEIERQGAPFTLESVTAVVAPRRLVFVAPEGGALELWYGSASATPPRYDLGAALARGRPRELSPATLRAPVDHGETRALAPPARGPALAPDDFRQRIPLELPKDTALAYVDLGGAVASHLGEVRIVDAQHRQVPFILEAAPRTLERPVPFVTRQADAATTLTLTLDATDQVSKLTLTASAPAYFERGLELFVPRRDQRGDVGRVRVATGRWRKGPESTASAFSLPVSLLGEPAAELVIADGDNPGLTLAAVSASVVRRRIDFLFEPGEKLELWWGNARASSPRYDLELLAARLLETPAAPAILTRAAVLTPAPAPAETPRWFWWAAVGSGLVVVLVLLRVGRPLSG